MNTINSSQKTESHFLMISAMLMLTFIASIAALPVESVTFFLSDDAYYYLLSAKNIILGNGSSFDGTNLSNGYHPQWMLLLLPVYWLFSDPDVALKAVIGLQAFISFLTINLCFRWCYKRFGLYGALASVVLVFIFNSPMVLMLNGLESAILLFWLFLLLYLNDRYDFLNPNASLATRVSFGVLLGGLAAARLDALFILMALALLKLIWPGNPTGSNRLVFLVKNYLPTIAIFLLVLSPYFIWNYQTFGHLSPISGSIKNTFPYPINFNNLGLQAAPFLLPFALAVIFFIYSLINRSSYLYREFIVKWEQNTSYMLLAAITLGCVIHLLWTRLFMLFGVYQWHFVAYIPTIVIFTVFVLHNVERLPLFNKLVSEKMLVLLLGAFAIFYNGFLFGEKGEHHAKRIEAAQWVEKNISEDDGVALSDAGVFGYFNKRTTLNLDGLINSYEFQQAILDNRLLDFLSRSGVKYIADAYTNCEAEDHSVYVFAWRGKNFKRAIGYELQVNRSGAIYRGNPLIYRPISEGKELCFSIWPLAEANIRRFE